MTAPATSDTSLPPYPRKPPVLWTDWAMVLLAFVSVILIAWISFFDVPPEIHRAILFVDAVICGVFAVEFTWRWRREGWGWRFAARNWYEILGMVPAALFAAPWFRAFRLVRIFVALARLARAIDRVYGDRITAVVVGRATNTVVDAVKRPITVAVLDEVAEVLKTGHYTANIAAALQENKAELDEMIHDMVLNDPQTKRVKYIPFHDEIIRLIADTVFRMVFQVLSDPRTDELVSDVLRENIDQMRDSVQRKEDEAAAATPGNTAVTSRPTA
ncbi:ion transporter [Tsukamurella sp. 1534]|uniref:ion transporter n=1 Tax=Tsukamurella sp. 1534 TaxID=1151061 RepID=UPI000684950E|nr:ion transporter [Tsukamurella sp. 1534]